MPDNSVSRHPSPVKPSSHAGAHDSWESMRRRCYRSSYHDFARYGGRGIRVCDRWLESFRNFLEDMGDRPPGMSLDRIDNDGNYEPDNCRWATGSQQSRNRSTTVLVEWKGQTRSIAEWAEITGITLKAISGRIRSGWDVDDALTCPSRRGFNPQRWGNPSGKLRLAGRPDRPASRSDFNIANVARFRGISYARALRWFDIGRLPGYCILSTKERWISRENLIAFLEQGGFSETDKFANRKKPDRPMTISATDGEVS